jgi:hypothetical protein
MQKVQIDLKSEDEVLFEKSVINQLPIVLQWCLNLR